MEEIFLPSLELTKIISGIPSERQEEIQRSRESIGWELDNLISNLGHRAITLRESQVRIGEDGSFSKDILRMFPYRIPFPKSQAPHHYRELYREFHEHVNQIKYERQIWGRLVTDSKGVLISDIYNL